MIAFFEFALGLSVFAILALQRAPAVVWTPTAGVVLLILTLFSSVSWWVLIPMWAIYAAAAALFNYTDLRQQYFTSPVLAYFRKVLPPMSQTEKIALDAGDVVFDAELFSGKPDWEAFLTTGKPSLTDEEQAFLDNEVETLCGMLNDWDVVTQRGDLPKEAWDYIKHKGFWGLVIPKEYGGKAFSATAHSAIVSKISSRCTSAAVTVMVPNSLGPAELLLHYGTKEQKDYYLPRLAKGDEIPCFGLTGTDSGSDAGAMQDKGIVCKGNYAGKQVLGIKLSWDKRYITLAPVATVLGVAFRLFDPDKLLGDQEDIGITLALIPTSHPGVKVGDRHSPLGLAFMNGPTRGDDVFIPLDWIIGGPEMAGEGWRMLMESLSIGRGISLPALGTSSGQLCYRMTGAYALLRKQFKLPIGYFEGVEASLGRIAGYNYLLESTRLASADYVTRGYKPAVISAIAKYHMTEMSRQVIDDAMDIHAGKAVQVGPMNYLGIHHSAIPVSITVEGANILTRNLMIFGQGAIRCHPYIRQEMEAANIEDKALALKTFDALLYSHIAYATNNLVRTFTYGLSGGYFMKAPRGGFTAKYYRQLTRMSAALATISDLAMLTLGGNLKRKEQLSARLGDVLSYLYMGSAVLKYYEDNGRNAADKFAVDWCLQHCLAQIQTAFYAFFDNFTIKPLGILMRLIVFPWGRSYHAPADKLYHQLARQAMAPSEFRDRLTALCYVGKTVDDPTGVVDIAFEKYHAVKDIEFKVQEAVKAGDIDASLTYQERIDAALKAKILNQIEAKALSEFESLRQSVLQVDSFEFKELLRKASRFDEKSA